MLKTSNLSHSYSSSNTISYPDIDCKQGEELLILGESGTGKTTLLHLLGGILPVRSGSVVVDNKDLSKLSNKELDAFRGKEIGIVFQDSHFMKSLTILENIAIAQKLGGKDVKKSEIKKILNLLNIEDKADRYPNQLSRGEKQRAAIARAIINKPAIILADEPTSALDDKNCEEVIFLLKQTAQEVNASLLIVTHDARLMDRFENRVVLS